MSAANEAPPAASRHVGWHSGLLGVVLVTLAACGPDPRPTPVPASKRDTKSADSRDNSRDNSPAEGQPRPKPGFAPPDLQLLRFACAGFDLAVADGAPPDRLLSHSAARAVELGGAPVEAATQRWALLPPSALLEEVQRYASTSASGPDECAGLRAHLERMAMQSGSH